MLLAVFFSTSPARAQAFSTPIDISNDASADAPQILVDSLGNVDIAYAEGTAGSTAGGIRFVRSSDGGSTFSKPVEMALNGAGDFSMALESDCTIDVAYFQSGDVFFSQSTDCGKTFAATKITQSNGTMGALQGIQMSVNDGTAAVAWVGGDLKLRYAQRKPEGGFSVPIVLFTQTEGSIGLSPMAVSNGSTDIVWTAGEFNCQLYFLNSFNGAQPAQVLPGAEDLCGTVPFAVDSAGNVNIVWRDFDRNGSHVIRFVRSAGQTGNFGPPESISEGSQPQIAIAPAGKIALAWAAGSAVLFSDSADGRATFSKPRNVAMAPSGVSVSTPQLLLRGDKFAAVAWEQVPDSGRGSDLWFSQSTDGGSTFSAAVNVTKNQSSLSAVQMVADPAGNILMVWSADTGNGQDIFFARSTDGGEGFTISATPSSLAAMPGGSATAQLTLTATGGFNQGVNLGCTGLPPGVVCLFSPVSVTPSSSGILVAVTLTVPTGLATAGFPFQIIATSPTISQFQTMQLTLGAFTGSVAPNAATIPLGGTANFEVTVASPGKFAGEFNLACDAPTGVRCTFTPSSGFLQIKSRATSTMTVEILSLPSRAPPKSPRDVFPPPASLPQPALPIVALVLLVFALAWEFVRRTVTCRFVQARPTAIIFVIVTLAAAAAMVSCGGSTTRTKFVGSGTGAVGTSGAPSIGGSAGAGGTTSGGVGISGSTSVTFPLTVVAQSGASVVNLGTVAVTVP